MKYKLNYDSCILCCMTLHSLESKSLFVFTTKGIFYTIFNFNTQILQVNGGD